MENTPATLDWAALYTDALSDNPDWRRPLAEMVAFEEGRAWESQYDGWQWHDVHINPRLANQMVAGGLLNVVSESRKYTHYRLVSLVGTQEALAMVSVAPAPEVEDRRPVDVDSLFEDVVGHESAKMLLRYALTAHEPVHCLLIGPVGSVPPDERVIVRSARGVERIPIVEVHDRFARGEHFHALSVHPDSLAIEWRPVTDVFSHPYEGDLLTVRMVGGRSVRATTNHSFLLYDSLNRRLCPATGDCLTKGDVLPVGYQLPTDTIGRETVMLAGYRVPLDAGLGFLFGMWLAEGSLIQRNGWILIHNASQSALERCQDCLRGLPVKANNYHGGTIRSWSGRISRRLTVSHQALCDLLASDFTGGEPERLGVKGRWAGIKRLPPWVYEAPRPFVTELLRGYFTGDGSLTKRDGEVCCYSLSRELLEDLALLLQRFGILATISRATRGARLRIPKEFTELFMREIGFYPPKGAHYQPSTLSEDQLFAVPLPANPVSPRQLRTAFDHAERQADKWISRFMGRRVEQAVVDFQEIARLVHAPVVWMKIAEVTRERYSGLVYDLTVEGNESFALDGSVFVHNTAKTMMLEEIGRLPLAEYYLGSTTTKAGIVGLLIGSRPRYLLIDELDKMAREDMWPLLTLMEGGQVMRLQHKLQERVRLTCSVFAGANEVKHLPDTVLSRFVQIRVPGYSEAEFVEVGRQVLMRRVGLGEQEAVHIASEVSRVSLDIRDAIKVGRLTKGYPLRVYEVIRALWPQTTLRRPVPLNGPARQSHVRP